MTIRHIDGTESELKLTQQLEAHFAADNNYAHWILREWEEQPYKPYIKPNSTILDIGGNIGLFALHVLPYAKRLISVEPTPQHMALQHQLLSTSIVEHEQAALNFYTGTARFRNEPVNTTMNTLREGRDSYDVACITLLDLCEKYKLKKVDFAKVDIEGSEWQALTPERIAEVKHIIKAFFVELHPRDLQTQNEFKARFESAGYNVQLIDFNGSIYATA